MWRGGLSSYVEKYDAAVGGHAGDGDRVACGGRPGGRELRLRTRRIVGRAEPAEGSAAGGSGHDGRVARDAKAAAVGPRGRRGKAAERQGGDPAQQPLPPYPAGTWRRREIGGQDHVSPACEPDIMPCACQASILSELGMSKSDAVMLLSITYSEIVNTDAADPWQ